MKRSDRARCASWLQVPCPVCAAAPGQRCLIGAGSFRAVFHAERSVEHLPPKKPVQGIDIVHWKFQIEVKA
jgi:hypothetical protein